MSAYDTVEPKEKWEFDEAVADCFENMLERSIPQYFTMRSAVSDLAYETIVTSPRKESFQILDIGCSDGLMLESLINRFDDYGNGYYYGVDVSVPMLEKAKQRFKNNTAVTIINQDISEKFLSGQYDVITSVLTLQFIPINYRQQIIQDVYNSLSNIRGTFLMVEKVLGNTANINTLFVNEYHKYKELNGYSKDQIERKRLSLEGVLVPVTNDWNIDLLKQAGFKQVDVFWRWMNFVGYIAIK